MLHKLFIAGIACTVPMAANAARLVYLSEQDFAYVPELFLTDLDKPGDNLKLNQPLAPFALGVSQFAISPDGSRIAFTADQDVVNDLDLFIVDIETPGTWTRIGSLPPGSIELQAKFSPDGNRLVYTAADANFADIQLYVVDLANPASATRMNGDFVGDGSVSMTGFEFSPDGSHLVYVAREQTERFELYAVALDQAKQSVKLNLSGGSVGDSYEGRFRIHPDGRHVVYTAVWQNPGNREVHIVALDAPGEPVTLNAPLRRDGDVSEFAVSPDGNFLAYVADAEEAFRSDVFLVNLLEPGVVSKLTTANHTTAGLIQFSPDSQYLMYSADGLRDPYQRDLMIVPVDLGNDAMTLSAPLSNGEDIARYSLSDDSTMAAYPVIEASGYAQDLMVANLDMPGSAFKINGMLPAGTLEIFPEPRFSPDGRVVAFIAVESLDESQQQLYFADVAAPGTSTRINADLPPEGIVPPYPNAFEFLPTGAPDTGTLPSNNGNGSAGGGDGSSNNSGDAGSGGGGGTHWISLLGILLSLACRRVLVISLRLQISFKRAIELISTVRGNGVKPQTAWVSKDCCHVRHHYRVNKDAVQLPNKRKGPLAKVA